MKRKFSLVLSICIALAGLCAMLFGFSSNTVMAERPGKPQMAIIVNTLENELNIDGDCSLREAITAANDNMATDACPAGNGVITDTITFSVVGTVTLTEQLLVTAGGPLLIDGGGVITVDGGSNVRVLSLALGTVTTLKNLILANGYVGNPDTGGGIHNNGMLYVNNCTLLGNSATGGGGIYNEYGELTIANSTLSGNNADTGGGIYNYSMLTITGTTISENSAIAAGGIRQL